MAGEREMTPEQRTQLDDLIGRVEDAAYDVNVDIDKVGRAGDAIVAHVESMLAELRATAARYTTLDLLHANGDVRIAFEEDGRLGVHLDDTAECAEGSWYGDNLDAVLDAVARAESSGGTLTSNASGATTITLAGEYSKALRIVVTVAGTTAATYTVDNVVLAIGSANSFDVYIFDSGGTQIARDFRWEFQGV